MKPVSAHRHETLLDERPNPSLPVIVRIESLVRLPDASGEVINRAKVSANGLTRWVQWHSRQVEPRLYRGGMAVMVKDITAPLIEGHCLPLHILLPLLMHGTSF